MLRKLLSVQDSAEGATRPHLGLPAMLGPPHRPKLQQEGCLGQFPRHCIHKPGPPCAPASEGLGDEFHSQYRQGMSCHTRMPSVSAQ